MNPHKYIDQYGLKKAERILDSKVCDANFYSEKTGSYYATDKNDSVNLTQLRRAIDEYKRLIMARQAYETRERHWIAAVNKE